MMSGDWAKRSDNETHTGGPIGRISAFATQLYRRIGIEILAVVDAFVMRGYKKILSPGICAATHSRRSGLIVGVR